MRTMRRMAMVFAFVALSGVAPAYAAEAYFVARDTVNLLELLAPPPGPQDSRTRVELDELRQIQQSRVPDRVAVAQADVEETIFRLTLVLQKPLTADQVPKTAALFHQLAADTGGVTGPAKEGFARPRPYTVARDLHPVCPLGNNQSYPSGHATVGYYMGVILTAMVPEQRASIFARTQAFAESRLICGVHYRSDIEAGRIAGTVLAALAMNDGSFKVAFAAAKAELRAALGM